MYEGQFYNFPSETGLRMVNINNIASIDDVDRGVRVTLNVKDSDDKFISFIATLPWVEATTQIKSMDQNQKSK